MLLRSTSRSLLAGLALGALTAAHAAGQYTTNRSLLTLLPVEATLAMGEERASALTADDYEFSGQLVKAFAVEGEQGAPITIDAMSTDFDPFVYLIGPDGVQIESDDDTGGACNARISTFFPSSGTYTVVAASWAGEVGAFTVRADVRQHPPAEGACGGDDYARYEDELLAALGELETAGTITLGESVEDELGSSDTVLADGSYARAYELTGTPGQTVVVDLASRAFDAMLLVLDPRGEDYSSDDDSGGACNSRIAVTLDMQPHRLVVTSFGSDATGPFTLSVSDTEGPMSTLSCPGP